MNRLRNRFSLVLLLLCLLFATACGDDDSSDDSADATEEDDDATDDDDAGDDDDNDDATDDDDSTDDDDDDDNDTVDYDAEPLAALECDLFCAAVDEQVGFSATDSNDPNGSTLTFRIDFGDGQSVETETALHAYDTPGAYRAVLTVTNQQGLTDQSSCDISVGDFPAGIGTLDEIAFQPNFYDDRIREQGEKPDHGGAFFAFFNAPVDAVIDTILINGAPGDPYAGDVEWCEVIEPELTAGDLGILRCHSYSDAFDAGDTVAIELLEGETTVWEKQAALPSPTLTLSYITGTVEENEILVHVRNDGQNPSAVTGLLIDGLDVTDFITIDNPQLDPGEVAIVHVLRCDGFEYGAWRVFTVLGTSGKESVAVSRPLRLIRPVFPHGGGGWNSDEFIEDPEALATYQSQGINTFMLSSLNGHSPETLFAILETNNLYFWSHTGNPGQDMLDLLAVYGDHPALLANATAGEPDIGGDPPIEVLEEVIANRPIWGEKPLWVYNACMMEFPAFAAIPDIAGMDHYCVKRPKCNSLMFPPFNWDYVERAAWYAHAIKKNAEPRFMWNWTQGPDTGWDGFWSTADEIRSQWYLVLSRGTKGMLWFTYKARYMNEAPAGANLEVQRVEQELFQMEEPLLEGDVAPVGTVAFSDADKLDVTATVSGDAMVVIVNNLWYNFQFLIPYSWNERSDLAIDIVPPDGFEPMEFRLLDGDDASELSWEKVGDNHWRFTLPVLQSSAAVLVIPEP